MLKQDKKGFTIIEVLIVLAIGGLIMLIALLAVPALQRNSRNSQRTKDVSMLLGGVTDYAAVNNGNLPADATGLLDFVKTGYYAGDGNGEGEVEVIDYSAPVNLSDAVADDRVLVVKGAKCGETGTPPVTAAVDGSNRQFVALYLLETASGFARQCQEG